MLFSFQLNLRLLFWNSNDYAIWTLLSWESKLLARSIFPHFLARGGCWGRQSGFASVWLASHCGKYQATLRLLFQQVSAVHSVYTACVWNQCALEICIFWSCVSLKDSGRPGTVEKFTLCFPTRRFWLSDHTQPRLANLLVVKRPPYYLLYPFFGHVVVLI